MIQKIERIVTLIIEITIAVLALLITTTNTTIGFIVFIMAIYLIAVSRFKNYQSDKRKADFDKVIGLIRKNGEIKGVKIGDMYINV
ncbi:MAG: hypothetical protein DWQ19_11690 [Crenarchaeota archaeon]|nr:MAG: hypothetical protein DWQ19_11690 [Thermoproteota archaeon]